MVGGKERDMKTNTSGKKAASFFVATETGNRRRRGKFMEGGREEGLASLFKPELFL